jgi:hypothetical protein
MDSHLIYSKTVKGLKTANAWFSGLSSQAKLVLTMVDGRLSVADILVQSELTEDKLEQVLAKLESEGYIRQVVSHSAADDWSGNSNTFGMSVEILHDEDDSDAETLDFTNYTSEPQTDTKSDEAAIAQAQAEEEARQQAEAERQVKAAAEKARFEAERISREKAKAEEAARVKAEAAARAKAEAQEKARIEAERVAREAAERKAEEAAAAKAKVEEEARQKAEAVRQAKAAAEEQARLKAEREKAEAEEAARLKSEAEAEARAKAEAEEKARLEAERLAREAAERMAREAAEAKTRAEEEAQRQAEAERKAKAEAEEKARLEAERAEREKAEAEEIARIKAEVEAQAKAEAEEKARIEAEHLAREESERQAREAAAAQAKAEEEARQQAEAERKAKDEAEEKARLEAERIEREKAEAKEAARLKVEADARAERKAREEAEIRAKAEAEERTRIEAERQAQQEAERIAREEEKAKREAEKQAQREAENAAREEAKRIAREEKVEKARLKAEERAREKELRGPAVSGKWMFRAVMTLLILIPLTVVLLVGVLQFINLGMLVQPVEKLASDSMGEPVTVREVHASLFPQPHLVLGGVAVGRNAAVIMVDAVHISPVTATLFEQTKTLKALEIESLTLAPADFGRAVQWVNAAAGSGKLKIERIGFKRLSFRIPGLALTPFDGLVGQTSSGQFSHVELSSADKGLTIKLTPQNGSCGVELTASGWQPPLGGHLAFEELTARGVIGQNQAIFSQAEGRAYGGTFKAHGTVNWASGLAASGSFELSKANLARALSDFGSSASMDGSLNVSATFASKADEASKLAEAPEIRASFNVLDGKIGGIDLVHLLLSGGSQSQAGDATRFDKLSGSMQFGDGHYKYSQISLQSAQVRASGNFDIQPNHAISGRLSAELTAKSRHLQASFGLGGTVENVKIQ